MIIQIKVKTNSGKSLVSYSNDKYIVYLKSSPRKNKANIELIDILSSHFNTSKSSVKIVRGLKSSNKLIEIVEDEIKKEREENI